LDISSLACKGFFGFQLSTIMIMQASTAFVFAFALLLASSVSSFVPTHAASSSCRVSTAQNALADKIFGMDLFAPVKDQNNVRT
jgi:hypothetical protein